MKISYLASLSALLLVLSCGEELEQPALPGIIKPGADVVSAEDGIYKTRQIFQPKTPDDTQVDHFIAPEPPFEYDVVFVQDETDFPNPERGAYFNVSYSIVDGSVPTAVTAEHMASARNTGHSLVFSFFYLCDYVDKEVIDEPVLQLMRDHFTNLRQSGCKAVLRFAYSWYWPSEPELRPVQEPKADIIVKHVNQIKPILQEYSDVIFILQAGLIGTYGEWANTTNVKTPEDHAKVVRALLDALPESRQVAIRTPAWKYRLLSQFEDGKTISAKDSITAETAFGTTDKARMAIHNDCAFVNSSDGGTFSNTKDRFYVRTEANYTLYGGESCYQNDNTYCDCVPSYKNLRTYRWSYLSNHYAIRELWQQQGCYNDATTRVGYRLIMNGAKFFGNFAADADFGVSLCVSNYGFASLINKRKMEFVIANSKNPKEKYVYPVDFDPRSWKGGKAYVLTERIVLPAELQKGAEYNLYLNLPDESPNLYGNPDYSVRFANKYTWEESTGYNLIATFKAEE